MAAAHCTAAWLAATTAAAALLVRMFQRGSPEYFVLSLPTMPTKTESLCWRGVSQWTVSFCWIVLLPVAKCRGTSGVCDSGGLETTFFKDK